MAKKDVSTRRVQPPQAGDAVTQHRENDAPGITDAQFSVVKAEEKETKKATPAKSQLPSFRAQLGAMFREGVKDVRQTMNEFFFSKAEHAPEMGTPMNPTPQNVTQDLGNVHGYDAAKDEVGDRGWKPSNHTWGKSEDHGQGMSR